MPAAVDQLRRALSEGSSFFVSMVLSSAVDLSGRERLGRLDQPARCGHL
jgi:hypothetical protein